MRRAFAIVVMGLLLVGCYPDMKAYEGPEVNDSQLALIGSSFWCDLCLRKVETADHLYFDPSRDGTHYWVKLQPGTYEITYRGFSTWAATVTRTSTIALEAGHVYTIYDASCGPPGGEIQFFRTCLWIKDSTTGQVVAGDSP